MHLIFSYNSKIILEVPCTFFFFFNNCIYHQVIFWNISLHSDPVDFLKMSSRERKKVKVKLFSGVQLFATPQKEPTKLLCPWDSSGKNSGVGCHFHLLGIFPNQGLNSCLLHLLHRRLFTHWAIGEALLIILQDH